MLSPTGLLDGPTGYDFVSGVYTNDRQSDRLWFAHGRPDWWTHRDVETRLNGDLYVDVGEVRRAFLLVDGAVAAESGQRHPGVRRLHTMVEHGLGKPPCKPIPPDFKFLHPNEVEMTSWQGRAAIRLRWVIADDLVEHVYDLQTRVLVRTTAPYETVEIKDLQYDADVDLSVFEPPDRRTDLPRGGVAYVGEQGPDREGFSVHWTVESGPGSIIIWGPRKVPEEVAIAWARERTDVIWLQKGGNAERL